MQIGVYTDHERKTCLAFRVGTRRMHFIELKGKALVMGSLPHAFFTLRFSNYLATYPIEKAARQFLKHNAGVRDRARDELNKIIQECPK